MRTPLFTIQPKIISVHIPKTAGSSFYAVLKTHYGWRLKHIQKQEDIAIWSTGKPYLSNKPFVQAIHGHIRPHQNWKSYYPNAKWVCWLRDPAERVLSAYYHLQKTQSLGDRNQTLFAQKQPTLPQFLTDEDFQPVIQIYERFLGNFNPADFAFIGRTEHFDDDLQRFAKLIHQPKLAPQIQNVGLNKPASDPSLLNEISATLTREYEIYNSFIHAFYP
jgi:hypothetical protein